MFNFLVTASLRNRLLVMATAFILVAYGAFTLPRIPIDVFPDLNRPAVNILTESEGLAPQEVEQLITFPIETAMNGMPGVVRVRGVSMSTARANLWPSGLRSYASNCRATSIRRWGRSPPSWAKSC